MGQVVGIQSSLFYELVSKFGNELKLYYAYYIDTLWIHKIVTFSGFVCSVLSQENNYLNLDVLFQSVWDASDVTHNYLYKL